MQQRNRGGADGVFHKGASFRYYNQTVTVIAVEKHIVLVISPVERKPFPVSKGLLREFNPKLIKSSNNDTRRAAQALSARSDK